MRPVRIAEFAGGEQADERVLFIGLGRRVEDEAAKKLINLIFHALIFLIESTVDNKKIKIHKDIKNNLDFNSNFQNMKCLFIFKGVILKFVVRERVIVVIIKASFKRCRIIRQYIYICIVMMNLPQIY